MEAASVLERVACKADLKMGWGKVGACGCSMAAAQSFLMQESCCRVLK
jgi:hypothetical protein